MPIYKKINKNFFKSWSPAMAYILGFMFADGNVVETKRGTYFFAIYTSDEDLLVKIKNVLSSSHKITYKKGNISGCYRLQVGSKEMFLDLVELGMTPNKAKRMLFPDIPKKFISHFVRGYFDGDGNVWVGLINKDRIKPTRVIQVSFTSASNVFLSRLLFLLRTEGLVGGSLSKKETFSRLIFSTKDALKLAKIMYNAPCELFLERKKLVFENFINTQV